MSTTYTVTANVKCWKKHECVDCGCEFRYQFKRTIQGTGNSEKAAHASANKIVEKTLRQEVDVRPCPSCGRIQPDMIGQVKARGHALVGGLTLPILAIFIVLGATYVLGGSIAPMIERSPVTFESDVHLSYGYQVNKNTKIEGFVRVFNLLNAQEELDIDEEYTLDSAIPIVGGDKADLDHVKILDPNTTQESNSTPFKNQNFGKLNARQSPRSVQRIPRAPWMTICG